MGGYTGRADAALNALKERQYAGNVRELRNIVVSAGTQSAAAVIGPELIPAETSDSAEQVTQSYLRSSARAWAQKALADDVPDLLSGAIGIVELKHYGNNRTAAAQRLGIHRETLRDKIQKHSAE